MQAIFTASWQRLSGKEQQLLAQVTIFRSGFTREAVTAITNASLRDLSVLVNKSLLTFDGINGRYHMHELLRQYAAEQLGENDALRDRHSTYYCTWLLARIDGLTGPEQMAVAHHVRADMPNVRSAIFHIVEQAQFVDLDMELSALAEYYYVCGQYHEGINLFRQIHEGLSRQQDQAPFALFWVSLWLADFHGILNQTTLAEPFLQQAKGLLETSEFLQKGTLAERAFLYHTEGYWLFEQEPEAAVQLLRQSQTLLEQLGNRVWLVRNLIGLARAIRNTGDLDRATATARRGYSVAQATGNPLLQVEARMLLGSLNDAVGNHAKAEAQLMEGVAQVRQLNHPQLLGLSLIYLGNNQMFNGRFEAILQTSHECQQISTEMGNHRYQIQGQIMEAESRLHLGQYEQCLALTQEARSLAQAVPVHHFIHGRHFQLFSRLALVQGNLTEARTQLLAGKNFLSKPSLGLGLGFVDAIEGDVAKAWQTIKPEIQWESKQKAPHLLAQLLAVAAYLYAIDGQAELAVTLYASARQYPFVDKSQWFADVVGKQVNDAAAGIFPEAVATARERGQKMDLSETAESIMNPL
jgi:tetratricopeptide (TPR) repeat protein